MPGAGDAGHGEDSGEQIWRRNKPVRFWYFPDYEVERVISLREQVKELAGLPLLPVPGSAIEPSATVQRAEGRESAASSAPTTERGEKEAPFVPSPSPFRLDADGPEPKWACDDVNLTRFFYLQGRSEY